MAQARRKEAKPTQTLFSFNEGESPCPITVRELPSIKTVTKSNLGKLEHLYRIAMDDYDYNLAFKTIDLMHKIMITTPTEDSGNTDITIEL